MRLPLALCLVCAGACHSYRPYPSEAELARGVCSVVREPAFTLYSPYDATATAEYADSVRAELGLLHMLIPDAGTSGVRIYLAPIAQEAWREPRLWETPSNHGLKGAATEGEFAFVYVPARIESSSALERATYMRGGTLRHELTHLYANRAGLAGAPWFDEGLALEVESMCLAGGALHSHPFPPCLLAARQSAKPGSLAELCGWTYGDELSELERSRRYVWAQAFFRFLLEQQPQDGFQERTRAVRELPLASLPAQEDAWLEWLRSLDALARIRAGAESDSADERALSIGVMPILAERGVPELATRAADELALEKLGELECVDAAATFLIFFRADKLRAQDLERLEQSSEPFRALVAQTLHFKRKEPFDLERAREAWQRVPENERSRLYVPAVLIPGLLRSN